MHRYSRAALASVLLLAGCKIERTPPEILDPGADTQQEQMESQAELQTRVIAFAEALGRGDRGAAGLALNPAPDARVLAPADEPGASREGETAVNAVLDRLLRDRGTSVAAPDLHVGVNPRRTTGWFSTHLEVVAGTPGDTLPRRLGLSGVFSREEGEWRLVQLHLSDSDPAETGAAPADSTAAER